MSPVPCPRRRPRIHLFVPCLCSGLGFSHHGSSFLGSGTRPRTEVVRQIRRVCVATAVEEFFLSESDRKLMEGREVSQRTRRRRLREESPVIDELLHVKMPVVDADLFVGSKVIGSLPNVEVQSSELVRERLLNEGKPEKYNDEDKRTAKDAYVREGKSIEVNGLVKTEGPSLTSEARGDSFSKKYGSPRPESDSLEENRIRNSRRRASENPSSAGSGASVEDSPGNTERKDPKGLENEMFPEMREKASKEWRRKDSCFRIGDLVRHTQHGIGRFRGLQRTAREGVAQEYAVIEYMDGNIFVSLSGLDCLARLTAEERKSVKQLDRVKSTELKMYQYPQRMKQIRRTRFRQKAKLRSRIREQLVNLHDLYVSRNSIVRPRYPVNREAEAAFERLCDFELTDDQKKALAELLGDLSNKDSPMDRLLCGDVGFGKTELALRAAFRVLLAGKQVAVVAPTTILALQHFETFQTRLQNFDPNIEVGCGTRFTKYKKMKELRAEVKSGTISVFVGTHTILSDYTEWNDLGLLVIDEEHRFGVNQKEKIRSKNRGVDTLLMSATPIPRTLHLTLSGLRDASVLKNPPPGRKPVKTRVVKASIGTLRTAVAHELERGGQIFFVVPRIERLERTAMLVRELFPALRVQTAHSKCKDLEKRVWAFAHGHYDMLLCTTIIENGIDMPQVNTIIVLDAQRFGLAQLHQLRGRVGRSNVPAFAWFMYKTSSLNSGSKPDYLERLKTLERHSGLGAGFSVSQTDMEMRGVGQILGVEQHGHTYIRQQEFARMLHEELEIVRTGKSTRLSIPDTETTEIYLPVASVIPDEYIGDFEEKMRAYTLLSGAQSLEEISMLVQDLEAQYGALPENACRHVSLLELRIFAKTLGIRRIFVERQHVILDWAIEEASAKVLIAAIKDKRALARFELVETEERVVLRGLGLCSGDAQLSKLRSWLQIMVSAAGKVDVAKHGSPKDGSDPRALQNVLESLGAKSALVRKAEPSAQPC